MLIGSDFLDTINVSLKRGKPTIIKLIDDDNDDRDFAEICQISVDSDQEINVADASRVYNAEYIQVVQSLIDNYTPMREIDIKMKLVLKDDEPIYLSPRRLLMAERMR